VKAGEISFSCCFPRRLLRLLTVEGLRKTQLLHPAAAYLQVRAKPTAKTTRAIIRMAQIVIGLRLPALANLRSACLLLRLVVILAPNPQGMRGQKRLQLFGIDMA